MKPVQLPQRRVPVALMKPLKEELRDLRRREIITVDCSTDQIGAMVVAQKQNGKPRVYIYPKPLSKAFKRSHFPLPTIKDILLDLLVKKKFRLRQKETMYIGHHLTADGLKANAEKVRAGTNRCVSSAETNRYG